MRASSATSRYGSAGCAAASAGGAARAHRPPNAAAPATTEADRRTVRRDTASMKRPLTFILRFTTCSGGVRPWLQTGARKSSVLHPEAADTSDVCAMIEDGGTRGTARSSTRYGLSPAAPAGGAAGDVRPDRRRPGLD